MCRGRQNLEKKKTSQGTQKKRKEKIIVTWAKGIKPKKKAVEMPTHPTERKRFGQQSI